jgi:succinate-semialdehyde dehydrogenase/glutarate-semialdehyde dehydrogenase
MAILSQNPYTEEILATFDEITPAQVQTKLETAKIAYGYWKYTSFDARAKLMMKLGLLFREKRDILAAIISHEMGMPVSQAMAEVEKSALVIEFYASNTQKFLTPEIIDVGAKENYISFEPLGTILSVAPWNFPLYLALRPVIPAIMAGNTVVLKHASNVPQCSLILQELFDQAGFPVGVFQSLLIGSGQIESIIKDDRIAMVTLIGSENAGSQIASQAGSVIKKTVMELGGSDPFIVLNDADIDKAVAAGLGSRFRNSGQSCNAAKRFILQSGIATEFVSKLIQGLKSEVIGDPLDIKTTIGPLASKNALKEIQEQVSKSVEMGAKILIGGKRHGNKGYIYEPTILGNVLKGMPVYEQEVFGPVAPIMIVESVDDAIEVANDSRLGLGASLWTQNYELAKSLISKIEAGNVFINGAVRSDPNLPYGGIKKSGFGREFGEYGIKEFVNIKTVVIR